MGRLNYDGLQIAIEKALAKERREAGIPDAIPELNVTYIALIHLGKKFHEIKETSRLAFIGAVERYTKVFPNAKISLFTYTEPQGDESATLI